MWSGIRLLFSGLIRRAQMESGMSEEMEFHIEARARHLISQQGLTPEEARRQARLEFGSTERYKEEARQAVGLRLFDEWTSDVRLALRRLRKNPGFALITVVTLAFGIGANTTIYSFVDHVLLKSLPVENPHELVAFRALDVRNAMIAAYSGSGRTDRDTGRLAWTSLSPLTFERIRDQNTTLVDVFGYTDYTTLNVTIDQQSEIAAGQFVTGTYFTGLGVPAALGRTILPFDDELDASPVAVVNHRYWQRRLGGAASAVGTTVEVNGMPVTIIGVAPETFFGTRVTETADFWIPIAQESHVRRDGRSTPQHTWWITVMGRLRPGVTPKQVEDDVRRVYEASVRESWNSRPAELRADSDRTKTGSPDLKVIDGYQGADGPPGGAAYMLSILFAIAGMLLLIVCANLANLFMASVSTRTQEMSVRLAIGAGRFRLIRQLLTECMMITVLGGMLGVVLAYWLKGFPSWFIPMNPAEPFVFHPEIDVRVLAFTALLSVLTAFLLGLLPTLKITRRGVQPAVQVRGDIGGKPRSFISKSLLVVQVSISLVLLVGAGLLIATVQNFYQINLGFNPANLVVFDVDPDLSGYQPATVLQLYERIAERLESVPAVRSVTMSRVPVLVDSGWTDDVTLEDGVEEHSDLQAVRFNFFETMGIPLAAGRSFHPAEASPVAIVNEAFAQKLFAGRNPVGSRVRTNRGRLREVVGVVKDSKHSSLTREERAGVPPVLYLPYAQLPPSPMTFEIRTEVDPASVIPAIRRAVQELDGRLPLFNVTTQETRLRESLSIERMLANFAGVFGVSALVLVCIGIYGIVSYGVTQRKAEIGFRMALGANSRDVQQMVLRETIYVTGVGILIGLGLAIALSGLIGALLYGITPYDPQTIIAVVILMVSVSLFAAYLPARRASRIDPMTALRQD